MSDLMPQPSSNGETLENRLVVLRDIFQYCDRIIGWVSCINPALSGFLRYRAIENSGIASSLRN
jgi:hypothetical protein